MITPNPGTYLASVTLHCIPVELTVVLGITQVICVPVGSHVFLLDPYLPLMLLFYSIDDPVYQLEHIQNLQYTSQKKNVCEI